MREKAEIPLVVGGGVLAAAVVVVVVVAMATDDDDDFDVDERGNCVNCISGLDAFRIASERDLYTRE